MKVGMKGKTRHGLRAEVIQVLGSFAVVKATTGAEYTIHEFEFIEDGKDFMNRAHRDAFNDWYKSELVLKLVGEGSGKPKSLMVTGHNKPVPMRGQATVFTNCRHVGSAG